jgi:hypothetical protein
VMLSCDPGQAAVLFVTCTWLFADACVRPLPERTGRTELTGTAAMGSPVSTDSCCSAFHFSIVKVPSEASLTCFFIACKDRCKIPGTRYP